MSVVAALRGQHYIYEEPEAGSGTAPYTLAAEGPPSAGADAEPPFTVADTPAVDGHAGRSEPDDEAREREAGLHDA